MGLVGALDPYLRGGRPVRPAHRSPLLWSAVIALAAVNFAILVDNGKPLTDKEGGTWLNFGLGMVTLALILWALGSYLHTRRAQ